MKNITIHELGHQIRSRKFKRYFNKSPEWFPAIAAVLLIIFILSALYMMPYVFTPFDGSVNTNIPFSI
jgi:hypothetical protein